MLSKYILNKYDIEVKVSERSKPSKSSKERRWDLYINEKKDCLKMSEIMLDNSIIKKKQFEAILKTKTKKIGTYEMMQSAKTENHHKIVSKERTIETDDFNNIFWFTGLFDSMYEVGIEQRQSKDIGKDDFKPFMKLQHSNKLLIEKTCSFLKNNNISYHIKCIEGKDLLKWHITTSGVLRVKNFIDIIKDYPILKSENVDVMDFYIIDIINRKKSSYDFNNSFKKTIDSI
jgi:hypothetical protein